MKVPPMIFIVPTLETGGAERVCVDLVTCFQQEGRPLILVLFERKGRLLESLPASLEVVSLDKRSRFSAPRLVWRLSKIFREQPDAVVYCFLEYANLLAVLAKRLARARVRVIGSVHSHLGHALRGGRLPRVKAALYQSLFQRLRPLVTPSAGIRDDLTRRFKVPPGHIRVIPNPIDLARITRLKGEGIAKDFAAPYLLAVGRLETPKGYPGLLKAYAVIQGRIREDLVIIGEGSLRGTLEQESRDLGIAHRVHFLGEQDNPYAWMARASVFVLASLWETFALVILEAMACAAPVVAVDCESGPRELIRHRQNGWLVPAGDIARLGEGLLRMLSDPLLRTACRTSAMEWVMRFDVQRISREYAALGTERFS